MQSSKLLKILKNLTEEEIRRFHKFIRSPYYSYKKHCLPFFEYIRRYYPDFTSSKLSKENAFHHLFPDKAFQSQKMRHVMTDLVNLLENFLVAEQIRHNDFQKKKLLRDAYGDRDLYEYFEKSTADITKTLDALPYRNSFYQHESMKNQEVYFFHPSTKKHLVKENYLESINEHLDQYYSFAKLQLVTEMKARASILSKNYTNRHLDNLLKQISERQSISVELELYMKALTLYKKDGKDIFHHLTELFQASIDKIERKDKQYIFHHLLNFTIRKGNQGDQSFVLQTFLLYELGLKNRIFAHDGKMRDINFTNICAVGIKVGRLEWVDKFILSYTSYLNVNVRENAKMLCLAFLFYARKDFQKTDELISAFNFTSPFYQLRAKILSLRALFELFCRDSSYYDLLQSNALAFEKFLRRNKTIGLQHKTVHLGFIQNLKHLVNLHLNHKLSPESKQKFKAKLINQASVINKDWLIQKIEDA